MPTLAAPLAYPLFEGGGLSADVPGKYDCALNGVPFMIDWKHVDQFHRRSVPLLKPQQDTSTQFAEQSLNVEEFARRSAESWHRGAGQTFHDRTDSDGFRFRSSKGADVWTKNQLTLLNDTALKLASANTNLYLAAAGARLYVTDGTAMRYTTDLTTWTAVTGLPAPAATGIASDGYTVYTTHSASGIYSTNTGTGASSSYNTRAANGICRYVKGRLIVSNDNMIVNITGAATEKIILTHPNTAFRWTDAAEGPGVILAIGYAGDKGLVYKTTILADGTDLAIMTVAGELPDGEIPRSIQGYLGTFAAIGTDKGLRLVELNESTGNVSGMGKVIPTTSPVYALEPQDRFVWYGLTNYDTTSTGLGRADLGEFTDTLTPAYASDLMATVQGAVQSAATFTSVRVFTVSGSGVWAENTASKVASATIDSGLVAYGLPDTKVGMYLDTRFAALAGSVTVSLSSDGGAFSTLQTASTAGSSVMVASMGQAAAETFEVRLTLTRDSVVTAGPAFRRWTMEANPAPGRGEYFDVPLLVYDEIETHTGSQAMNVLTVYQRLLSIEALGRPVSYQDVLGTSTVFLDDHDFLIDKLSGNSNGGYQGTFVVRLRRPRVRS